ncbi:Tumor necrosis factor receptor superfamily member 25 [Pteropus alecto]|uniref:Tumor necrosis factor receptor superfamily member 25 n=1 Tax=Pteropus alecto TaxID=9402 RepID=L5KGX6_PTEAL|nr:Tumor necrosis factor receptor superfamily member 25 [Pteropus alecto]
MGSGREPRLGLGPPCSEEGGPQPVSAPCLAGGHYLAGPCTKPCGNITCLPCPPGTFLARENHHETSCARCLACDEQASQVALENCSALADTHCGCKPGWFMDCLVPQCIGNSPFHCHPCLDCGALHRHMWVTLFWVQVLLAGLVVPLLLGATLTYVYRRCQPCKPMVPDCAHTLLVPPSISEKVCTVQLVGNSWTSGSSQTQEATCPEVPWSWDQLPSRALGLPMPPAPSPAALASLQPGPQLYDVMDAVPVRRWKEFVRTLGLREAEIEAVEVEVGRFRDQQYEMLKRWRQQQPAGLGAIYAALERMGLDGCAEDLRNRLQRGS